MKPMLCGFALACASMAAQDLNRSAVPLHSAAVTGYVEQLGARLAAADDPTNEPRAWPAGQIFVRAALILACQDEAEFAGILAHAMAHVAERPVASKMSTIPLIFIGTGPNENLIPASQVPTRRRDQMEADRLAAQAMAQAGFNPVALLAYLERRQPNDTFRSERIESLRIAVRQLPARPYESGSKFEQVQAEVRALTGQPVRQAPSLLRP